MLSNLRLNLPFSRHYFNYSIGSRKSNKWANFANESNLGGEKHMKNNEMINESNLGGEKHMKNNEMIIFF